MYDNHTNNIHHICFILYMQFENVKLVAGIITGIL